MSIYRREEASAEASPTMHVGLLAWVDEIVRLARPDRIRWCDGSDAEWTDLTDQLVDSGTLVRLDPRLRPNSFHAKSDPSDVARMEARTFVCPAREEDAGPTNNWDDPTRMRERLTTLFDGCMRGRVLYVVPFCMGPIGSAASIVGVELTDSPYVVLSMRIMTRIGTPVLEMLGVAGTFVRCVHSVGMPLGPGTSDVAWPCNEEKWIAHYPETREIWSFGSGYGGNALLGKKCLGLRIASVIARDEGWFAEHMLILKITGPSGQRHFIAAAFPSACGKTNLAMIRLELPGWRVETLGDDIAWMRFGADGRLYACNPEAGFFGVAPGTGPDTNPNAIETLSGNCIFTNTALTADGDVWWEGLSDTPPDNLLDWTGAPWRPGSSGPAAHPNARFTVPAAQCPSIAEEWSSADGVPISAILFGGRRASAVPLAVEALEWEQGVYLAANIASETTAAAEGEAGRLRRDPFAMLAFCGYNVADYLARWAGLEKARGADARLLPRIFLVNWFRKGANGAYLWPGFEENARVLRWIVERIEGGGEATQTAIGFVPTASALGLDELALPGGAADTLLSVDLAVWNREAENNRAFIESLGDRASVLLRQQDRLEKRLRSQ